MSIRTSQPQPPRTTNLIRRTLHRIRKRNQGIVSPEIMAKKIMDPLLKTGLKKGNRNFHVQKLRGKIYPALVILITPGNYSPEKKQRTKECMHDFYSNSNITEDEKLNFSANLHALNEDALKDLCYVLDINTRNIGIGDRNEAMVKAIIQKFNEGNSPPVSTHH